VSNSPEARRIGSEQFIYDEQLVAQQPKGDACVCNDHAAIQRALGCIRINCQTEISQGLPYVFAKMIFHVVQGGWCPLTVRCAYEWGHNGFRELLRLAQSGG